MSAESEEPPVHRRSDNQVLEAELRGRILRTLNGQIETGASKEYTRHVLLESGIKAVVKFAHPDSAGEAVRREVAAYVLDQIMGIGLVPPTVMRMHPVGQREVKMSAQLYVPGLAHRAAFDDVPEDVVRKAAAFDLASCQIDRLVRNWGVKLTAGEPDGLALYDNTWSFDLEPPDPDLPELRGWVPGTPLSVFCVAAKGGPDRDALERLLAEGATDPLKPYLSPDEIERMLERVRNALEI